MYRLPPGLQLGMVPPAGVSLAGFDGGAPDTANPATVAVTVLDGAVLGLGGRPQRAGIARGLPNRGLKPSWMTKPYDSGLGCAAANGPPPYNRAAAPVPPRNWSVPADSCQALTALRLIATHAVPAPLNFSTAVVFTRMFSVRIDSSVTFEKPRVIVPLANRRTRA